MTEELERKVNIILDKRRYRTYFDSLSHEFGETEIEYKLDKLAILAYKNLIELVIEHYLNRFEDDVFYRKLTVMTIALATTLKYYIGYIRYEKYPITDEELFKKDENDLKWIIATLKEELINTYIPKRGYNKIFTPYL